MSNELKYWLGFNLVSGIGPAKLQAMLDYFGSVSAAWQANRYELQKIGIDRRALKSLENGRSSLNLDRELERVQQAGVTLLTWEMEAYPTYLREVPNPPPLLYQTGRIEPIDKFAVAIVGTRRLTSYGRQITRELVTELVRQNITIVSGLARGIDMIAHETAVESNGRTIAVLGSGIDTIYPAEHRQLAQRINQQGAVISEYGLGVKPEAKNFPPRNRIISGLSLGVVVVEAGKRSGALITTNFALEQGREVFAVPGNVNSPASKGPNRLIQQGAKLVMGVDDILEELNMTMVAAQTAVQMVLPESTEEIALYAKMTTQPVHIDELTRQTGLATNIVSSTLTLMELKGIVRSVGGMNYALVHESRENYAVSDKSDDI